MYLHMPFTYVFVYTYQLYMHVSMYIHYVHNSKEVMSLSVWIISRSHSFKEVDSGKRHIIASHMMSRVSFRRPVGE